MGPYSLAYFDGSRWVDVGRGFDEIFQAVADAPRTNLVRQRQGLCRVTAVVDRQGHKVRSL
jgi:hypothetical protein